MSRCRAGIWSHFLHQVGFTYYTKSPVCSWSLTPRFHPYSRLATAVYFCCTVLGVASTGSYPAPLLCDARTFLVSCPTQSSNCLLLAYCTTVTAICQALATNNCVTHYACPSILPLRPTVYQTILNSQ